MGNRKAQKYLLIGFEKLVETYQEQLLPKAAHILKALYDNDLLEEEIILEWADKVGRRDVDVTCMLIQVFCEQASKKHVEEAVAKQIHEKVAPVVNWLRTAEEESEEESEDEEDDVEVVYSERASETALVAETVTRPAVSYHKDVVALSMIWNLVVV